MLVHDQRGKTGLSMTLWGVGTAFEKSVANLVLRLLGQNWSRDSFLN